MAILQINYCTVYLEKYSKTLSLLFCFFVFFLNSRNFLTEHHYLFQQNIGIVKISVKSQYSPRNKKHMAMLLIINVSRNVQLLFFYITRTKFGISFQSQKSHHRASQSSSSFQNPKSIFHFINIIENHSSKIRLSNNIFNFLQIKCLAQRLCSFKRKLYRRNMLLLL